MCVEFNEWKNLVRDPAKKASEGIRRIEDRKHHAYADYQVAPLPDGRWAIQTNCAYRCGNLSGLGTPWSAFQTREECISYFLQAARQHFGYPQGDSCATKVQKLARLKMLHLLKDTLFGFIEPEPMSER